MKPEELSARSFDRYPPRARAVAVQHLEQLKQLPVPVLASFLDRIVGWDWRFPTERDQLAAQLNALERLTPERLRQLARPFADISLPPELARLDWLNAPAIFLEQLTAYLWSAQKIDGYRAGAKALVDELSPPDSAPATRAQRLVIVTCGADLAAGNYPLFSKLRKHGLRATNVSGDSADGWLAEVLSRRTAQSTTPYAHWLLDGDAAHRSAAREGGLVYLSYRQAEPVRTAVLKVMERAVASGWGPELLRSRLAQLSPSDCHADAITNDPILQHFVVALFAEGSGTQIYSTSFVQWSAREILRRAHPETLVVRVTTRVRQRTLNEFVSGGGATAEPDRAGSAIDGDLAAYYTWLELQKLPGAERSVFLAWFAGHREALLIGPGVPKNVSTANPLTLAQVLAFADMPA